MAEENYKMELHRTLVKLWNHNEHIKRHADLLCNTGNFEKYIAKDSKLVDFKAYKKAINLAEKALKTLNSLVAELDKCPFDKKATLEDKQALIELKGKISLSRKRVIALNQNAEEHAKQIDSAIKKAKEYVRYGQKMLQIAMKATRLDQFEGEMEQLEQEINNRYFTNVEHNPQSRVNVMACFHAAQDYQNFKLNQGYMHGSNINQYGNGIESANKAADFIWTYFTKQVKGKKCAYQRRSTHDFVSRYMEKNNIATLPEEETLHYGMDIYGPNTIPLFQKKFLHLLIVRGKIPNVLPQNSVIQLLVKSETWGLHDPYHWVAHAISYVKTRPFVENAILALANFYRFIAKHFVSFPVVLNSLDLKRNDSKPNNARITDVITMLDNDLESIIQYEQKRIIDKSGTTKNYEAILIALKVVTGSCKKYLKSSESLASIEKRELDTLENQIVLKDLINLLANLLEQLEQIKQNINSAIAQELTAYLTGTSASSIKIDSNKETLQAVEIYENKIDREIVFLIEKLFSSRKQVGNEVRQIFSLENGKIMTAVADSPLKVTLNFCKNSYTKKVSHYRRIAENKNSFFYPQPALKLSEVSTVEEILPTHQKTMGVSCT